MSRIFSCFFSCASGRDITRTANMYWMFLLVTQTAKEKPSSTAHFAWRPYPLQRKWNSLIPHFTCGRWRRPCRRGSARARWSRGGISRPCKTSKMAQKKVSVMVSCMIFRWARKSEALPMEKHIEDCCGLLFAAFHYFKQLYVLIIERKRILSACRVCFIYVRQLHVSFWSGIRLEV